MSGKKHIKVDSRLLQKAGYAIQKNIQETADQTLNYYDENAIPFSESTLQVDFEETQ